MTVAAADIVNQALQLIGGNQPAVTGVAPTFDDSTAGKAAQKLYVPCVQTVGRQWGWDMARNTVALAASGNSAPFPWSREYLYPSNGIQVWQVMPTSTTDTNNPLPVNWAVANVLVSGTQTKVIHTDQNPAQAVYNNNPGESLWDPLFREAVVRLLASELAMALAARPETAEQYLRSGSAMEQVGETRDS